MIFPELSFFFCIFLCLLLLTVPLPWVGAAILAAAIHECAHLGAIYLLGGRVEGLSLKLRGAEIQMEALPPFREFLAAAAGPLASLLLGLLLRQFPRLALCGLIQGLFNLLPIYPMDGGRMVSCLLGLFLRESTARRVLSVLRILTLFFLASASVLLKQPWGLILVISLIFPILQTKIPCKDRLFRVQ